jgi:predicted NUDIX family NTP pyrophosphohydrolase
MTKHSAGLLLYRRPGPEVLLVHPGGPFFTKKDHGMWSIPKGLIEDGEDHLAAAKREFTEETGCTPHGKFLLLGSFRQSREKIIHAWAVEGEFNPARLKSNTFELEWPPRSGRVRKFPEVDRAAWFSLEEAGRRILAGQRPLLGRLVEEIAGYPLMESSTAM